MEGFFARAFTPELEMDLLTTGQIFAPFIERTKAESKADGVMEDEAKRRQQIAQIAMNLLADGMSPEYAAKVAGMDLNEAKNWRAQRKHSCVFACAGKFFMGALTSQFAERSKYSALTHWK